MVIVSGGLGSALLACSLIFNADAKQCSKDSDCAAHGFANTVCAADNTCQAITDTTHCDTNQTCIDRNGGKPFFCRKPDRLCFPLTTGGSDGGAGRCDKILSDPRDLSDDNAVYVGAMMALTGPASAIGQQQIFAIDVARDEMKKSLGGLPSTTPNTPRRPVVVIGCDEIGDPVAALDHLTKTVKVPAIIGPTVSAAFVNAIGSDALNQSFLMSPVASSPAIAGLDRKDRAFSINPSDAITGSMMSLYTPQFVEARLRANGTLPGSTPMKLVVLRRGDSLGTATASVILNELKYNGGKSPADNGDNFKLIDIGDPFDTVNNPNPQAKYAAAAQAVLDFKPHVILSAGSTEVPQQIMSVVETNWGTTGVSYRPVFVGPFHNESPQMIALLNQQIQTNAAGRYRTGQFGAPQSLDFKNFVIRYQGASASAPDPASIPPAGQYAAQAYDAMYLIALSIAGSPAQVTAQTIADAFKRTQDASKAITDIDPNNLATMVNTMSTGGTLHLSGTSGPLDFDLAAGSRPTDIQVRCPHYGFDAGGPPIDAGLGPDAGNVNTITGLATSGLFYSVTKKDLEGAEVGCETP